MGTVASVGVPTALLPVGQPSDTSAVTWTPVTASQFVSFSFQNIAPPSPLYVGVDDKLVIYFVTDITTETINATARLLLARENRIVSMTKQIANPSALVVATITIPLAEGYLLSLFVNGGTAVFGHTFARAFLIRGVVSATPGDGGGQLCADYITGTRAMSWPWGQTKGPGDGFGQWQTLNPSNPSAGADWTFSFNAQTRTYVRYGSAKLVTSATVANRLPRIILNPLAGNPGFQGGPSVAIPASTTAQVSFGPGLGITNADATSVLVPLPENAGLRTISFMQSSTVGLQAGDQWSNIVIEAEQFFETI